MERRKNICLVTGMPELLDGRRVAKGVFEQCEKYGYNVAVFASMSHLLFFVKDHTDGEKNIYSLPNYGLFDGIILDTITLVEDNTGKVPETVYGNIKAQTNAPAVCISIPYKDIEEGYPERMKIVAANSTLENGRVIMTESSSVTFDTKLMLPELHEYSEKPCVFYFAPVHFSDNTLGYAVLQRELSDKHPINLVFRNWLRLVNNSLEMVRAKNRYAVLSVHDNMKGLYNRRGMYEKYADMLKKASPDERLFVCVIDMDGLKYINDTFGHGEGDCGIMTVSRAAKKLTRDNEICVRAGGDEFFIIGIGAYPDSECAERRERFVGTLSELSADLGKPCRISASIGCSAGKSGCFELEEAISRADEEMYRFKMKRKRGIGDL